MPENIWERQGKNRSFIHYREREGCIVVGCNFGGLWDGYHTYGENTAAPLVWMRAVTFLETLVHVYKTSRRHLRHNNIYICFRENLKSHTREQSWWSFKVLQPFARTSNLIRGNNLDEVSKFCNHAKSKLHVTQNEATLTSRKLIYTNPGI